MVAVVWGRYDSEERAQEARSFHAVAGTCPSSSWYVVNEPNDRWPKHPWVLHFDPYRHAPLKPQPTNPA